MTLPKQLFEIMMVLVVVIVISSIFFTAQVEAKVGQICKTFEIKCSKGEYCHLELDSSMRCRKLCKGKKNICAKNETCVNRFTRSTDRFSVCEKKCTSYVPVECSENERCITLEKDLKKDNPSGFCTRCEWSGPCSNKSLLNQCCLGYVCSNAFGALACVPELTVNANINKE